MPIFNKTSKKRSYAFFDINLLLDLYRLNEIFQALREDGFVDDMSIKHAANVDYPLSSPSATNVLFFRKNEILFRFSVNSHSDKIDFLDVPSEVFEIFGHAARRASDVSGEAWLNRQRPSPFHDLMITSGMHRIGGAARFNMAMQAIGHPGRLTFPDDLNRNIPTLSLLYGHGRFLEFDETLLSDSGLAEVVRASGAVSMAQVARDRAISARLLMSQDHDLSSTNFKILADIDMSDIAPMSQLRGLGLDRAANYGQRRRGLMTDIQLAEKNAIENDARLVVSDEKWDSIEQPMSYDREETGGNIKHWFSWADDHAMCIITTPTGEIVSLAVAEALPISGLIALNKFLREVDL